MAVAGEDGEVSVVTDEEGDVSGHGTACGGIVRAIAPECELHAVRVLGPDLTGTGKALLAGLEWAVRQGFDVINMSLSTRKRAFADVLRELADDAYFQRSLLVCSAHNATVESFPWRFASVVSVGSHDRDGPARLRLQRPRARGVLRARDRRRGGVAGRRRRRSPRATRSRRRSWPGSAR